MCYNYEFMIERGTKRSVHESGGELDMNSLSEKDRKILEEKAERLKLDGGGGGDSEKEVVNSFPGQETIVIPITTMQRELYIFGFLPSWSKTFNDHRMNYNARSETIMEKPTWKTAFKNGQRCLVVASAFYETDRSSKKSPKPRYRFSVINKDEVFYAGIFNYWIEPGTGKTFKTFAIITCEANDVVGPIHDRMPVIINEEAEKIWMNPKSSIDEVVALFKPFPVDQMKAEEVPPLPRRKKSGPELGLEF
jgi:putative SOS response-associated peptidase YedK